MTAQHLVFVAEHEPFDVAPLVGRAGRCGEACAPGTRQLVRLGGVPGVGVRGSGWCWQACGQPRTAMPSVVMVGRPLVPATMIFRVCLPELDQVLAQMACR